jgi:hypothetical protein
MSTETIDALALKAMEGDAKAAQQLRALEEKEREADRRSRWQQQAERERERLNAEAEAKEQEKRRAEIQGRINSLNAERLAAATRAEDAAHAFAAAVKELLAKTREQANEHRELDPQADDTLYRAPWQIADRVVAVLWEDVEWMRPALRMPHPIAAKPLPEILRGGQAL